MQIKRQEIIRQLKRKESPFLLSQSKRKSLCCLTTTPFSTLIINKTSRAVRFLLKNKLRSQIMELLCMLTNSDSR